MVNVDLDNRVSFFTETTSKEVFVKLKMHLTGTIALHFIERKKKSVKSSRVSN